MSRSTSASPGLAFRIVGIPIVMPWSGLLGIGVVAFLWSDSFRIDPANDSQTWVLATVFAVLFYASILVHELAHAAVARMAGFPVHDITLWVLGGYTSYERRSASAWREGLIAAAGPAITILLGLACRWAADLPMVTDDRIYVLLRALGYSNVLLGIFNALPGLPLDGGAVLRAIIWRVTGNESRATIIASWAGRVVAVTVFVLPIYFAYQSGNGLDTGTLVFSLMIAAYLFQGASTSLARARLGSRIPDLNVRMFIKSAVQVDGSTPLAQALRLRDDASASAIIVIDGYGSPVGIVQDHALAAVPVERRPWVPTSSVAVSTTSNSVLNAELTGQEFISVLAHSGESEHLVMDEVGEVLGVLSTEDVERALSEHR